MDQTEVLTTYNEAYAASYDEKFILDPHSRAKTVFELDVLTGLLTEASSWLDVACGTGYFLRTATGRNTRRVGFDLSPAMIAEAKRQAPSTKRIGLSVGDFLDRDTVQARFDLVTCMWLAPFLQPSLDDVATLFGNLAHWTSTDGMCFIPALDPERLAQGAKDLLPGMTLDTPDGTQWSFIETDGSTHRAVLAPPLEWIEAQLKEHFQEVVTGAYPDEHYNLVGFMGIGPSGRIAML